MASASPNRAIAARPSTVLTTGEVAAATLDLNDAYGSEVTVQANFTLGMLTNVTVRYYVSTDGSIWIPVDTIGGGVVSHVLTADTTRAVTVRAPGFKWFRASAQGSGTVTNSLLALTYRFLRRGSQ